MLHSYWVFWKKNKIEFQLVNLSFHITYSSKVAQSHISQDFCQFLTHMGCVSGRGLNQVCAHTRAKVVFE
jgi:hypothetical protein